MIAGMVEQVRELARGGRTERAVAADIDTALCAAGFERPAFETIVAGGPNSALPHAHPTERVLADGDLVVLHFGGVHHGYCLDLTRTMCIGRPGPEPARLHQAVAEAHVAALRSVRPGVAASQVDTAARTALAAHGLDDAFGHSTGHGLGIEVHELPRIGRAPSSAGAAFHPSADVILAPGESVEIGDYRIKYLDTAVTGKGDRTEYVSTVEAFKNGDYLGRMTPRRTFYPEFNMSATRAHIRSNPVEDFYVIPSEILDDGSTGFRVFINPLVWWMWVAGPVLILGTVVALWPQRGPAPAYVRQRMPRAIRPSPVGETAEQAGND